jgi:hypothetical protein
VCKVLDQLLVGSPLDKTRVTKLQEALAWFKNRDRHLIRHVSLDSPSPRTVLARAGVIEDVSRRANPTDAKINIDVSVTDAEYFSIARFSGGMSLLLMTVVLLFFAFAPVPTAAEPLSAEVLAIVLTLFSAIQAGRIERPDRSTLRGLLSAVGNWLIAASILPAVILAVALGFSRNGLWVVVWAAICIGLQLLFQAIMRFGPLAAPRPKRRGSASSRLLKRRSFNTWQPDYHYSEDLRSDWWRSTTADALKLGRKAYAYVVWQQGSSPSLPQLLKGARQANAHSPDESSGSVTMAEPTIDNGAATARSPANILALLRSGTVNQAATFVVFREQPIKQWAAPAHFAELELDPDRLAPQESFTSTVDIFIGVHCGARLTVADHPLAKILSAAAHHLIVQEVQLPVPAPVAGDTGTRWARVRVGLRDDEDIKRLARFLDAVHECWAVADARDASWVVAVQAVAAGKPRIITEPLPESVASESEDALVLESDIDVLNTEADTGESADVASWRVLAMCADARSNIETNIVQGLGKVRPQLQLVGLTYARLHGTAVALLLGHEPKADAGQEADLQKELRSDPALAKLHVLVNKWQSRKKLGLAEKYPLLRLHVRSQDWPGGLLTVLESLGKPLSDRLKLCGPDPWRVWYAQTLVTDGQVALTKLTVRLRTDAEKIRQCDDSIFEEIEQKVRILAAQKATDEHRSGEQSPEDPVISVRPIKAPTAPAIALSKRSNRRSGAGPADRAADGPGRAAPGRGARAAPQ